MNNWDINKALQANRPSLMCNITHSIKERPRIYQDESVDSRLYRGYQIAALAVKEYGEVYLQIFQRLHNEIKNLEKNKLLLSTAFAIAKEKEIKENE